MPIRAPPCRGANALGVVVGAFRYVILSSRGGYGLPRADTDTSFPISLAVRVGLDNSLFMPSHPRNADIPIFSEIECANTLAERSENREAKIRDNCSLCRRGRGYPTKGPRPVLIRSCGGFRFRMAMSSPAAGMILRERRAYRTNPIAYQPIGGPRKGDWRLFGAHFCSFVRSQRGRQAGFYRAFFSSRPTGWQVVPIILPEAACIRRRTVRPISRRANCQG